MKYLKTYRIFESITNKSELIESLKKLAIDFEDYVEKYNKHSNMKHNIFFTYADIETYTILKNMKSFSLDTMDGNISAICYEAILLKRAATSINKDQLKYEFSQASLQNRYLLLSEAVEKLIRNTSWDFPDKIDIDLGIIEDCIVSEFSDVKSFTIRPYSNSRLDSATRLVLRLKLDENDYIDSLNIRARHRKEWNENSNSFLSRLSSMFGGCIELGFESFDSNNMSVLLPFTNIKPEDIGTHIIKDYE